MAAKIFLTTYTVHQDWINDPLDTLEKIKGMGYEGVELDLQCDEGLFKAIKNKMEDLDLQAVSAHTLLDDAITYADLYFDRMRQLGMKNLIIAWLPAECTPGGGRYEETKSKLRYMAERCKLDGIRFHFHNHNFEFEKVNGVCKLDILLQDIPELYIQLDVCWCVAGGQDPAAYIRHYGHRMPTLHLKDFTVPGRKYGAELFEMLKEVEGEPADITRERAGLWYQPLGLGQVDLPAVFKAAGEVGVSWMGVEQDASPDRPPMEAARMSMEYLKKIYL